MPHDTYVGAGTRIAAYRKLRHLTQRGLATRAAISYSYLTKIESGALPATPAVVAACARALSVDVATLTSQPYLHELRADHLDALIHPIREALDLYDIGADDDVTPRPLPELDAHSEELCRLVRAGNLRKVGTELPGLITELTAMIHGATGTERERAFDTLARVFRSAYDVTTKLGYYDLCGIALDRMEWAAVQASSPALAAMRQYMRALAYMRAGRYARGQRLIASGQSIMEQAEQGTTETLAVTGQLHLGAAVLAARAKDKVTSTGHLKEAGRVAERTGEVPAVQWLAFGPTNVAVHEVSALAELERYSEAVDAARGTVVPASWPASRSAHHHAEVARAQMWVGQTDAALGSLLKARKIAPQQTRHHPVVHETIAGLVTVRRSAPDSLSGFAQWMGI